MNALLIIETMGNGIMKRLALLTVIAVTSVLVVSSSVLAGTGIFTGVLTTANPLTGGSPNDDTNICSAISSLEFYYSLHEFQVTVNGDYQYFDDGFADSDLATIDAWATFYTGSASTFDPANPLGNGCFANFDDTGTVNLTAGTPYLLMVTSFSGVAPNNLGNYVVSLTGPGDVVAVAALSNPMLADGRINGQQAAPVILYCNEEITHALDTSGQVLFDVANGESAEGAWGSIAPTADGRMLLTSRFNDGKPYYFIYDGCDHGHYDALSGDPAQVFDSGSY